MNRVGEMAIEETYKADGEPFSSSQYDYLDHLIPAQVPAHVVRRVVLELLEGVSRRTAEAEQQSAPESRSDQRRPA